MSNYFAPYWMAVIGATQFRGGVDPPEVTASTGAIVTGYSAF
jgi:hypothetical protein